MRLGDLLEWLAAAALITSAYLWSGIVLALAVTAVALFYFAQVYSGQPIWSRKRDGSA